MCVGMYKAIIIITNSRVQRPITESLQEAIQDVGLTSLPVF